jgi:hypothetical protein
MFDKVNGVEQNLHGEVVNGEFVDAYTTLATRAFFINLGGTEEMRRTKGGVIVCKSVSPPHEDGTHTVREARFIPLGDDDLPLPITRGKAL